MQDILETLAPVPKMPAPRAKTLSKALGLLRTERPAPTDAEIERWLEEHLLSKYG